MGYGCLESSQEAFHCFARLQAHKSIDVDELKRENEALKAKLAEAEAKAAAAIDA